MSRKDYKLFAEAINNLKNFPNCKTESEVKEAKTYVAELCSQIFSQDNYLFDYTKFFKACGL